MSEPCACKQESKIAMLEQRDGMIQDILHKLEGKVDLILVQVTKVAVLEVNHEHQSEALSRAFSRIDSVEKELVALAKEARDFQSTMNGMARMAWYLWTGMGMGLIGVIVKLAFNL